MAVRIPWEASYVRPSCDRSGPRPPVIHFPIRPVNNPLAAIALLGATVFATPALAHEGWYEDFDQAAAAAKEQKKDLLVDFTGSDWCGWCIKLNEEVFDHDEFREGIAENYVLVALDFPRGAEPKAKVPNPKRNEELKNKYAIRGFPTILLMNADGVVYGQTGYQPGGPEAYLKHIDELRSKGRGDLERIEKIVNGYKAAAEADKTKAMGAILDALDGLPADSPFKSFLVDTAHDAFEIDPENKAGLKLRALTAISKSGKHTKELLAMAIELDGKNAVGAYEAAVWSQFMAVRDPDGAKVAIAQLDKLNEFKYVESTTAFLLNLTAADWCTRDGMKDLERSKGYAVRAQGIGHEREDLMETANKLAGGAN